MNSRKVQKLGELIDNPTWRNLMARTTITLEIDPTNEAILRDYASFLDEMNRLATSAPSGAVLATCEEAVVGRGRDHLRRVLQQAIQARVDDAEKKGRR